MISISAAQVTESSGTYSADMQFVVTLSDSVATDVYIDYQTLSGTAEEGIDFARSSGTLYIPAGETSGLITATTYGGTEVETDESFTLELTNPVGDVFAGDAVSLQATGVIIDDDSTESTLALLVSDAKIVEGDSGQSEAMFEIRLSQPSEETITLNYTTSDVTAEAGSDYEAVTGTVTFLPGETVKSVTVNVNGDTVSEVTEQFTLVVTPTEAIANGVSDSTGTATLLDDDAGDGTVPVVSISSAELVEGDGAYNSMEFVVTLSEASDNNITIDYQTIGDSAIEGVDFSQSDGTLTIAAGDTSAILTITTRGYTEAETDESFTLELTNPVGAAFAGDAVSLQATGVIIDDDSTESTLALLVSDAKIVEGDSGQSEAMFEIRLSQPSEETITLNYTTSDVTAEAGSDYEAVTGTVTFLPGETVKSVTVNVNGDTVSETTDQFTLVVTPTEAIANGVSDSTGTATLLDDDAGDGTVPVVSISSAELVEGDGAYNSMEFVVTLSEASDNNITIDYQTIGDSAIEGVDFSQSDGTLTIAAGDTSAILTITTRGYTEAETDESFTLELTNPVGAAFSGDAVSLQATGVIIDDDSTESTLALLVGDAKIVEGDSGQSEAVFEIRLSQPSEETITLNYTTSDVTAEAGSDYEAVTGTVTFLPGETVKSVTMNVNGDTVSETTDQFTLVVTPTEAIANGVSDSTGTATLLDDDAGDGTVPVVSISSAELVEGDGAYNSMEFVVTLSEASDNNITIDYQTIGDSAIEGVDFSQSDGTLTIAAGDTSAILTITTRGYTEAETDESFTLELTNPVGAAFSGDAVSLQATGVIIDDDSTESTLALLVGDAKIVEGDSGQSEAVFEVRLSQASDTDVTVAYTTVSGTAQSGEDFEATKGTITFQAGETTAAVHVSVSGDTDVEVSEQFSLVLSAPEGAEFGDGASGVEGVATILDDDASDTLPVISIAVAEVFEGDGAYNYMDFVVTLSEASTEAVQVAYSTVDGTALAVSDYNATSGTLTIPAGDTSAILTITTRGGTAAEDDEEFTLKLSSPVNAVLAGGVETLVATGTIIDDDSTLSTDGLPLITVADIEVQEAEGGATATFTINLSSASESEVSGSFSVVAGTATADEDFTPVSGTFTFSPGETSVTITVDIAEDAIIEETETFVLRLDGLENAAFEDGSDQLLAIGEILDQGNLAPVANDDLFTSDEDASISGNVLDNDTDANGDGLTVVAGTYETDHGSVTISEDGSFTYTPEADYNGEDSFTYTVSDGTVTDTGTVTLTVNPVNDGVVAVDDAYTLDEEGTVSGNVLENDTDADGDSLTVVAGTYGTDHGSVTLAEDGAFTYTPDADFSGTDSTTYAVSDGSSTDTGTITFTVEAGNDPPVAADDAFTSDEDSILTGYVLLDNGNGADSDADGDALTVTAVAGETANVGQTITLASGALLTLNADGSFAYGPNGQYDSMSAGETTTDSFEYTVSDGNGGEDTARVSIEFSGVNDAPVGYADTFTAEENTAISVNVFDDNGSGADFDPEGDEITALLETQATNGAVVLNADGSFVYTPNADYFGTDTFTYTLSDGEATSEPVTVTLNITEDTTVDPSPFSTTLDVPDSMTTCQTGTTTVTYTNDSSESYSGVLILVEISGGLLADPQTGAYSDSLFLLGLGDGIGDIESGETGTFELDTKLVSYPGQEATVTTSVIDLNQAIDWSSQKDLLKPEFLSDEAWDQIYENFTESLGDTGEDLADVLAENAGFLEEYGVDGSNATTALAFELEQAGDFGSLAERTTEGSLGDGWAFIGDLGLDISEATGNVSLLGTSVFAQLFSLSAEGSAYYIVSSSVDKAVSLSGDLLGGAPENRATFSQNVDGSYVASSNFSGELNKTDDGYQIATDSGLTLYFDTEGRFVKAVTQSGLETIAEYDADGNISVLIGPYERSLTIVRDETGQVTSIQDSTGYTVDLTYAEGQLVSAATVGSTASFTYDMDGYLSSATSTGEPVAEFTYDDDGRLQSIDVGSGAETVSYEYDSLGGYTVTDGAGTSTHVALAPSSGVTAVTNGLGQTTSLLYDESGQLTSVELADGSAVDITVDELGRITSITDPEGSSVSYTYEGDSFNPVSFTDANDSTRSFTYNELGQMISAEWPDGTSLAFTWDENGNLETYTTRSSESITYAYDQQGNLLSESDGTSGPANYTYNSAGRLLSATSADGTTTISYDDTGNITQIQYPNGLSLSYTYDEAGNRSSMTDQHGNVQYYTYDAAGRLATISNAAGQLVAYTYDNAGNLLQEENGNGTVTNYSYDAAGRLLTILNLDSEGNENSHVIYTYDELGQRVGMETQDGTWSYGYDGTGQLLSAEFVSTNSEIADKSIQYNYDDAGNRTSVIEDGDETVYVINELNQYVSVGDDTYTYDDNGNLISKTDEGGIWNYSYDVENRLTLVTSPSGDVTEYEYDVFGNRCAVIENGVETTYLVDPFGLGNVVAEYDDDGDQVASYVNGLGLVAQVSADGTVGYYNTDGVYSVTGITDDSGDLVNDYVYTPFGEELYESETIDNGYEYNGVLGVYEDDNDLIYMRARYYDSEDGRFISEDPLWLDGDPANLYRFAYNDPNSFVDSNGEEPEKPSFSMSKWWSDLVEKLQNQDPFGNGAADHSAAIDNVQKDMGDPKDFTTLAQERQQFASGAMPSASRAIDALGSLTLNARELIAMAATEAIAKYFSSDDSGKKGSATGDPHLKTFDNLAYDFQGYGEFTLVRGSDLEIQIRTAPWEPRSEVATVTTAVAMQVGDAVVGLYLDHPNEININGEFVELEEGETVAVSGGGIYRASGNTYVITNEHGDGFFARVNSSTNGYINVNPFLCANRAGEVGGLLGNADGDRSNDIALPDGTVLSESGTVAAQVLYTEYADSWRVTDETTLFIYGEGESTATYTVDNFPFKVFTVDDLDPDVRAAAEQIARDAGLVEGTPEFDAVVLDVGLTGDPAFAEGVAEYVDPDNPAEVLVVQEAPEPLDDIAETNEDTSVFIDVLANDTDPEGDTLQIVSASDVNGGTVEITDEGLRYTPPENFNGETTLTYEVTDGQGNTVSADVTVTVASVPDAPVAAADQFTTDEETSVSGNVLEDNGNGADSDVEGDSLTVVEVNGDDTAVGSQITLDSGVLLTLNEDGSFSYDPNGQFDELEDGQEATDSFEYTISDGQGGTDTQTVTVNISGIENLSLNVGENAVQEEGTTFSRLITFSDGLDTSGDGWSYEINWGDGNPVETGTTTDTSFTISRDLTDGDTSQTVTVTIYDGDDSISQSFTLETTNVAPILAISGEDEVDEGSTYTLNLEDIVDPGDDTHTITVDWGDGSGQETVTVGTSSIDHVFADGDSTPAITVTVEDSDGASTTAEKMITVNNVAPSLVIDGADEVDEGSTYTLNLEEIVDPGDDTHTITVDWGDGSDPETVEAGTTSLDHVFTDGESMPTITVTVEDSDGASTTSTKDVIVNNVAPSIAISGADEVDEGAAYTLNLGDIVDPGDDGHTITIDWGDGTEPETIPVGTTSLDHVFANGDSTPTITVSVADSDGADFSATKPVTVNNVAPTLAINGADEVDEGSTYTLNLADVVDPGDDDHTITVDWGDGSDPETFTDDANSIEHVFADGADTPTITVTVTDSDGAESSTTKTVTVNNVAPAISLSGAGLATAGETYTLTLGDVVDPGDDAIETYIIDWGDGTTDTIAAADLPVSGNVTHTFENSGEVTIQIDLTDEDGTYQTVDALSVTVSEPAAGLVLDVGEDASKEEGTQFSRLITFSDGEDTNGDGWTYEINWGDGNPVETGTTTDTSFTISRDLTDGDSSQTVTVTIYDGEDSITESFTLETTNVAPILAISGEDEVDEGSAYTLNLEDIVDPGDDTHTITVDWGDGSDPETVEVGTTSINHVFTDGDSTPTISLTVIDSDGASSTSTKSVTVNNVAPIISIEGAGNALIGDVYTLTLSDVIDPGTDTLADYIVDWGDGTAPETIAAEDLPESGELSHLYGDAGSYIISIDLADEDGSYLEVATQVVDVAPLPNLAPVAQADEFAIAEDGILSGDLLVDNGNGADTDPDGDLLTIVEINGLSENVGSSIVLDSGALLTVSEDGQIQYDPNGQFDLLELGETATESFEYTVSDGNEGYDTQTATITITGVSEPTVIQLGDAPTRLSRTDRNAWVNAWSDDGVTITHKADYNDDTEEWSDVALTGNSGSVLAGGDILSGDLGVSGTTLSENGAASQELDGSESLKFELEEGATTAVLDLSSFYFDDDGEGNSESVRLQAFDAEGNLVEELIASADSDTGESTISFEVESGFSELVVSAGAYDGERFVYGSLINAEGSSVESSSNSEFLIDSIEFEFGETQDMDTQPYALVDQDSSSFALMGVVNGIIDDVSA